MRLRKTQTAASYEKRKRFPRATLCVCVCGKARLIVALRSLQNRERTGVPARAPRVGWWMRPGRRLNLNESVPSLTLRVLDWTRLAHDPLTVHSRHL